MNSSFISSRTTQNGTCVETQHSIEHRVGESAEVAGAVDFLNVRFPGCRCSFFCDTWDDGYDIETSSGHSIAGHRDRNTAILLAYEQTKQQDAEQSIKAQE